MSINPDIVEINLPQCYNNNANNKVDDDIITIQNGNEFLNDFCETLCKQQEENDWKVTLGQKSIGGTNAINGADILTSEKLDGPLLNVLINDFTSLINDLDTLTKDEEKYGYIDTLIKEIELLHISNDITTISNELDTYVGKCIIKNFHPEYGRLTNNLRNIGKDFLYNNNNNGESLLFLTEQERIPAIFLGILLQDGANMDNIFIDCPIQQSALDLMLQRGWLDILDHAISYAKISNETFFNPDVVAAATDRIWTCGLTDCGLHNSFLSVERGLELFDLGVPTLEPRPAFLTKLLMSIFHTSGMEEDEVDSNDNDMNNDVEPTWKIRFDIVKLDNGEERLTLTSETVNKLPYLHNIFNKILNHLIDNIFYGEESIKQLLIKYVILQLLSDSSFCLQKWEIQGGGNQRYGKRLNNYPMEKWLWRSLWDQYIACYVYANFIDGYDKQINN